MRWSYRIYLVEETNEMGHEMIISNIISRRDKWNGTWDDHIEYN